MSTPTQINGASQFNQFLEFAQLAMKAGNTKAIAREGVAFTASDGTTTLRTVGTATDDKVYAIRRSHDNKQANDAARSLFKKAVGDMFGGESRIPPSVLKAMNMKDYGCGKPLTARRIMAVKTAIDLARAEPVLKNVGMQLAATMIDNVVASLNTRSQMLDSTGSPMCKGVNLSPQQQQLATTMLARHGNGLTRSCLNLLAGNIVRLVSSPLQEDEIDGMVARIAKDISKFRNFAPGNARLKDLDEASRKYVGGMVKDFSDPAISKEYSQEGLSDAFVKDARRCEYTIVGQKFVQTSTGDETRGRNIEGAFKAAVPNIAHRRILSSFMSQINGTITSFTSKHVPVPPTTASASDITGKSTALYANKGASLLLNREFSDDFYFLGMDVCDSKSMTYNLEISPDGKRAKVTCVDSGNVTLGIAINYNAETARDAVGQYTVTQEFTFDLSANEPKVLSYHISQSFGE